MNSTVYILLASYNGEKYIEKQLDSIIAQTYTDWRLLIRDDGSKDRTVEIINSYVKSDERISIVDENNLDKGKGSCQNFAALLTIAVTNGAPLIMFCDQDDYWFPIKVETMRKEMISNKSNMLYSNFLYADESLTELPVSVQKSKSPFIFPSFKSVIIQNHVYGCTMMIDGELAKKCLPIPVAAENHDYWITLVASGTNAQIFHLQQPLMLYRQHSSNVTGSVKDHYIVPRIKRFLFSFDRLKKNEHRKVLMLESLYTHLEQDLAPQNRELLKGYLSVLEKSWTQIVRFCIQHKIKRQSVLSTVVLYTVLSKLYQSKNSEK